MTSQRLPGPINAHHASLLSPQKCPALSSEQSWDVHLGLLMSPDSEDTPGGRESWRGGARGEFGEPRLPSKLWSKDWLVLGGGKCPGASHCLYVLHASGILHVTQVLLGVRRTVGRMYGVQVVHTAAHAPQWTRTVSK